MPPTIVHGSYIGNPTTTYVKDELLKVFTFKCDFGPDNYISSIECGENGWNDEPNCPEPGKGYNIKLIFYAVLFCKRIKVKKMLLL